MKLAIAKCPQRKILHILKQKLHILKVTPHQITIIQHKITEIQHPFLTGTLTETGRVGYAKRSYIFETCKKEAENLVNNRNFAIFAPQLAYEVK